MSNQRSLANATAPGIALAHTLNGSHKGGSGGVTHAEGGVQPAGLHSMAPYVPPKRRQHDNPDRQLCSTEGCKAYPIKKVPYCAGHARALGLVDWDNTPKAHRKSGKNDDTGRAEAAGTPTDGDDVS